MAESTTPSPTEQLTIVPAREADVDMVLGILYEAADWLALKGFDTFWKKPWLTRESVLPRIRQHEVFLAKLDDRVVGTITLQWDDPVYWNGAPADAGYIHKFAVRRAYSGRKIGDSMMRWAEEEAVRAGKKYLRLDCLAANKGIREYYEKKGFIYQRDISPRDWRASLYEKRISTIS